MNIRNTYPFLAVVLLLILAGCAGPEKKIKKTELPETYTFRYVDGIIDSINGNMVTIRFTLPEFDTSTLPFTNRVTQKIINKSFLLENGESKINNQKIKVLEVRGNQLTVRFEQPPVFNMGDSVKIFVPKKTAAIVDFEVVRGHDKTLGTVSMESLTTAMVNSGQFNIVERNKLKTILKEYEIGFVGLSDAKKAKQLGNLVQADFILTGTFANLGGYWNVNLRLINVSTGLIVAAIEEKALFSDVKPDSVRDVQNLNASFEGKGTPGWIVGTTERGGAFRSVGVDKKTGANGTSSSMRMRFTLRKPVAFAPIINLRKRDLSLFSGIEFYAKADQNLNMTFGFRDENRDSRNKTEYWFTMLEVGTTWEKHRIAFDDLSLSPIYAKKFPGGDTVLNLDLIARFNFMVTTRNNLRGTKGTLWVDEIRFY
jgi:curli biogenesis system outer membrane secretion channel CsgG